MDNNNNNDDDDNNRPAFGWNLRENVCDYVALVPPYKEMDTTLGPVGHDYAAMRDSPVWVHHLWKGDARVVSEPVTRIMSLPEIHAELRTQCYLMMWILLRAPMWSELPVELKQRLWKAIADIPLTLMKPHIDNVVEDDGTMGACFWFSVVKMRFQPLQAHRAFLPGLGLGPAQWFMAEFVSYNAHDAYEIIDVNPFKFRTEKINWWRLAQELILKQRRDVANMLKE